MGNAVNRDDLALILREYTEAGIGGVEITEVLIPGPEWSLSFTDGGPVRLIPMTTGQSP